MEAPPGEGKLYVTISLFYQFLINSSQPVTGFVSPHECAYQQVQKLIHDSIKDVCLHFSLFVFYERLHISGHPTLHIQSNICSVLGLWISNYFMFTGMFKSHVCP